MLPVLATATYLASLIALWGFTSLALDEDVITEVDAGVLLGPSMAAAATLVVLAALWRLRARPSASWTAVAASTGVYAAMLIVGLAGRTLATGTVAAGIVFAARYATSPFVVLPALAAGVTVVAVWAATRERGAPRHPEDE
jgi:hypothetical protein